MLDDSTASIIPLHQTRRPKTAAERQRAHRQRKRQQRQIAAAAVLPDVPAEILPNDLPVTPVTSAVALPVTANVTPVTPAVALPVTANITESLCHVTGGRPISS
jgi:hypothetical protein